mmetsp:Transcript_35171/g.34200  ORF Transcript_35171/g.34200 Transcript_35171/m.34200 type:complete len:112 (+) Transcript_35171:608-943(+)
MGQLVKNDAKAFFQTISVLFIDGPTSNIVKEGRPKEMSFEETSITHKDLLNYLHTYCYEDSSEEITEEIRLEYLSFVTNVASKCHHNQDKQFFYKVSLELLKNHEKYVEFN